MHQLDKDTITMLTSESINALSAALAVAQGQLADPTKGRTANTGTFKYSYASLQDCLPGIRATLSANGLAVVQECADTCVTRLVHKSGEWLETEYPLDLSGGRLKGAQARGSAVTYARRYSLMALLGLAAEDDDGHSASTSRPEPVRAAPVRAAPVVASKHIKTHADFLKALPVALGANKEAIKAKAGTMAEVVDAWLEAEEWGKASEMGQQKLTGLVQFIASPAGQAKMRAWLAA